jgi:hypothetical protein
VAIPVIRSEMTRVDVRRGEQWRRMPVVVVAIKMSIAPVVVAETALTLSRGTPLGWVCIRQKILQFTRKDREFRAAKTEDK